MRFRLDTSFRTAVARAALCLVIVSVICRSPAYAQESTITGTVRANTGEPLSGALVTTPGDEDRTDEFGRFSVRLSANQPRIVVVEHPSYRIERVQISAIAPGADGEIALTLVPVYALDA